MTAAADARFWDRVATKYAAARIGDPGGYEHTLERTRGLLRPDDHVLELGCGTGMTAMRLAGSARSYLATDFSGNMIAIGNDRLQQQPVAGLAFRQAAADDLAAEDRRFDVVLGFNYLHLTRDPRATLEAIGRLLRPGGLFVSKTPCLGEMNFLVGRVLLPAMRAVGLAPHVNVLTGDGLKKLVAEANFSIAAVEHHASKGSKARPFIVAVKG